VKPHTYLPAALLLALCSCAATGKGGTAASAPGGDATAKDGSKDEALQKKERELNYARLQLQITELDLQADERSQKNSLIDAERGVRKSEEELSDYLQTQRQIDSAERTLGLDQQQEGVRESQQEYDELESMYKDEDFAKKTKELVLSRGKARLGFAQRGMELASSRHGFQEKVVMPRKERDLREAIEKARTGLEDARASAERKQLSNQLQLLRAKDGLDDLQKEVEKLKQAAEKPTA